MIRKLVGVTLCALASVALTQAQPSPVFDVVIHNGRVMDGSGNPWVRASIGIPDGGGPVDLAAQRAELETPGVGVNVALLIGHASVRRAVIGGGNRQPTPEELEKMRGLVRRGMEQGAFGLSSGLFYTPGSYAKTEELVDLTRVAAERGGVYTSHIRDE